MLNALPTAVAVALLCLAVTAEILVVPVIILPGGTVTLLAGALIGAGRPPAEVAIPVCAAVIAADQLAYFSGAFIVSWWRRRRPERSRPAPSVRRGRAARWLAATMPSLAAANGMPYREFAPRLLVMRVPWLAAALFAGTLAADSLRAIGHVAGVAGVIASVVVVAGLFLARHRPQELRELTGKARFAPRVLRCRTRLASRR